jgi:penicillin amidase
MEELNSLASTSSQTAGYFVPGLLAAIDRQAPGDPQLREARDLLASWDHRRTDSDGDGRYDSPGLVIYDAWLAALCARVFSPGTIGKSAAAILAYKRDDTYDIGRGPKLLARVLAGSDASLPVAADYLGGRAAAQVEVEVLRDVLSKLAAQRGTPMKDWADPVLESRFAVANAHAVPQGAAQPIAAPLAERGTENHLVELRADGAAGRNVVAPGQAENGPAHVDDQVGLFRDFGYKAMNFTPDEIGQNTETTVIPADPFER